MSSLFLKVVTCGLVVFASALLSVSQQPPLKVCADPHNLPFSSRTKNGFENRIANTVASELGRTLVFTWSRMGRGFIREYLNKGQCDLLFGVPVGMRGLLITTPYYRSSYVFLTRANIGVDSLDDPRLRAMKIGIQVLDDDYAPPARALARRGIISNIVGFDMDRPKEIVAAVLQKRIDVAIVWGPIAGYYARSYGKRLRMKAVEPEFDAPGIPFAYDIAVGVRKADASLLEQVNAALQKSEPEIKQLLLRYNVPTLHPQSRQSHSGE